MDWALFGTFLVAVSGVLTAYSALHKNRKDAKANTEAAFDKRYEAIYDQIQDHLLAPLSARVTDLQLQHEDLLNRFTVLERRFRLAVEYIRLLRGSHPNPPVPPRDLEDEL